MDRAMAANTMAIVFALVAAFAGGRYCWKALTHRIAPRLATWLIFLVASALSLASYLAHAHTHASFAASIANRFDVVEVGAIVVSIFISARHDKERLRLGKFDLWCLASAVLIGVLWIRTGSSFWAYILLQILMCVGYWPTLQHLLKMKLNTEPFDVWLASFGIAVLALVPPLLVRPCDWLAVVYPGRATLSVLVLLFAMRHYHRKTMPR